MNLQQRITNALYAQAVIDAVGNPFEFQTNINPKMVVAYANEAKSLVISDDTQMAMFGFEAIGNFANYPGGDIFDKVTLSFTDSYLDWHYTQTHDKHHTLTSHGLLGFKSLYSVQAPGNTCLSALHSILYREAVKNTSMGCGSVMRLLPLVSLFDEKFGIPYIDVIACASITGNITHKHTDNFPAIEKYMKAAFLIINGYEVDCPEAAHISELGDGWIAPEAVQMAIWAYCKAESFDDLLALSIAHDGDSDSVGAIAGSLWGLSGREVPQKYIDKLDALTPIKYIIDEIITE